MAHNPGWWVYQCRQATMLDLWYIFQKANHEDTSCALFFFANQHHSYKTTLVWLHKKNWFSNFVSAYAWKEQLLQLHGFLVSLLRSEVTFECEFTLCTVSPIELCWLAKKRHLKLFCRKSSSISKYIPLSQLWEDGHRTHTSSLLHRSERAF